MSSNALKKHLDIIRKKGHEVQRANGHYSRMGHASKAARDRRNKGKT